MTKRRHQQSKERLNFGTPVSPFATMEYRKFATTFLGFLGFYDLIRSGIRPGSGDPKAWYDRIIRVSGGLILLVFGIGFIIMIVRTALTGVPPR
jgi:hypothetical protein